MIHIGRSGSTVVGDLLNQHPLMMWDREVYQRVFRQRQYEDQSLPSITDVDAVGYLVSRSRRVFSRYYGFETKFFHLRALGMDLASYIDALDEALPNVRFVVLKRKNTLRVVVSTLAARATEMWNQKAYARPRRNRVRIESDAVFVNRANCKLVDLLQEFDRDFVELKRLLAERPFLHLTYEDDVMEDPRRAYKRICDRLNMPAFTVRVRYSRANPYPLPELIEIFEGVEAALRRSDFEWMLKEG